MCVEDLTYGAGNVLLLFTSSLSHVVSSILYRSVHNVRIERLWVDVTAQVGSTWADFFTNLELYHGLDINNVYHIWLIHYLFLPLINQQLTFFADSWNQHRIQIRDGPNRSPADMFGFDMIVHGVRGNQLPEDELSAEELEVYGVDWEGLQDDRLLRSQRANNTQGEGWTSWVGRTGPPDHLSEVSVQSPQSPLLPHEVDHLEEVVSPWRQSADDADLVNMWTQGLGCTHAMYGRFF